MKCYLVSYNGLSNAGGVERVCYYISEIMKDFGYEVVVVDKQAIEEVWLNKLIKFVYRCQTVMLSSIISSIYVNKHVSKGDVIITNGFNCPFVAADILVVHGTMQGYANAIGAHVKLKDKWTWLFEKIASKNAKRIISVSRNAINEVQSLYTGPITNYHIVNNMVDQDIYKPLFTDKNDKYLNIIYCGRLDYGKGIYNIKALCDYIEENELKAKLVIAANNPHNKELFERYSFVEINIGLDAGTLNAFYNKGDVMYFPSMYEGFEMVTLEALCAGVPVLGNNIGAVSELTSRGEPGVAIVCEDKPQKVYAQLMQLSEIYSSKDQKNSLHDYYANNYGKEAYRSKLKFVLSNI